uniref:Small ribosomal subunit protein uS5 n=1 Tax=Mustela putorius furo TaxID=9669 RepID=M3YWI1_MUSPF
APTEALAAASRAGSRPRSGRGKAEDQERIPIPKLGQQQEGQEDMVPRDGDLGSSSPSRNLRSLTFLGASLKDEVSKTLPVQKQTRTDQVQVLVAIRDYVGLGVQCSKEVAAAICGTIIVAKLSIMCGNKTGQPHSVSCEVTGCCDSGLVRLIPNTRGTGIVSTPVPKKLLLMMAHIDNLTLSRGAAPTLGNFTKTPSDAIPKTYSALTPDLWKETMFTKSPYQEFTDSVKIHTGVSVQRTQDPAVATA